MKRVDYLLWIFVLPFWGCTSLTQSDITLLEGYWVIESVRAHGEIFQPRGNAPAVDYYYFYKQNNGTKIKMTPQFNGSFKRSQDQARFVVQHIDNRFYLNYATALEPWREEIITLNKQELVLYHNEKTYHYKRFQKLIP